MSGLLYVGLVGEEACVAEGRLLACLGLLRGVAEAGRWADRGLDTVQDPSNTPIFFGRDWRAKGKTCSSRCEGEG